MQGEAGPTGVRGSPGQQGPRGDAGRVGPAGPTGQQVSYSFIHLSFVVNMAPSAGLCEAVDELFVGVLFLNRVLQGLMELQVPAAKA